MSLKNNLLFLLILFCCSHCTVSKIYPVEYYNENKDDLHALQGLYTKATEKMQVAIAFSDLDFHKLSIEFKTDTVKYVYDFSYGESRVNDSVSKFGFDTTLVQQIIKTMHTIKCSWINTLDYYFEGNKKMLLFMSVVVRQFSPLPLLQKRKYYLFNFYEQPQYYDEKGRLLDKKKLTRLRKVNNEIFWRITDKVCYTVSGKFR